MYLTFTCCLFSKDENREYLLQIFLIFQRGSARTAASFMMKIGSISADFLYFSNRLVGLLT